VAIRSGEGGSDSGGQSGGAPGSTALGEVAYLAPASSTLQALVELCVRSGHPVLLEEAGEFRGCCGEAEIMRALAGARSPQQG